jgi:hypothetical protein
MEFPMKSEHMKRGRRPMKARDRKDRIVQARVPEKLDDALREAAELRQTSVSQLVRNLLEDAFHLVDNLVADSASLMDTVARDARRMAASAKGGSNPAPQTPVEARIEAWQAVVTNHDVHCQICHRSLTAGSHAWRASGPALKISLWRCNDCLPGKEK